jgi:hypothetical protein
MFSRSINDTSRVVRMAVIGVSRVIRMMNVDDATTWSIILMTLESSFTIVIYL